MAASLPCLRRPRVATSLARNPRPPQRRRAGAHTHAQPAFSATGIVLATAAAALFLERARRLRDGVYRTRAHVEYVEHARGASAPCVVLEAGANSWSTVWSRVVHRLTPHTRTFAYDRPGLGRARFAGPRSVSQSAHALLAELDAAGAHPPYVLVAHSLGSLYANEALSLLPRAHVLGVVYVDAASLESVAQLRAVVPSAVPPVWLARTLSAFGVLRALAPTALAPYASAFRIEPALWAEARALWARAGWLRAYASEWRSALREVDRRQPPPDGWLGSLPIAVIVPDIYDRTEGKAYVGAIQRRLARYSSDAKLFPVQNCGHFVQLERPDVVVEAVQHIVQRARKRQREQDQGDPAALDGGEAYPTLSESSEIQ